MNSLVCKRGAKGAKFVQLFLQQQRTKTTLKSVLADKIPVVQQEILKFRKEHGSKVIGNVTVDMIYGGMRGSPSVVCETSEIDPDEGVRFRGHSIKDLQQLLPKAVEGGSPLPEGIFWLLLTGEIPTVEQTKSLSQDWMSRSDLPSHIVEMLNNFPSNLPACSQLSAAITALNSESKFARAYQNGIHKSKYWEHVYEDSMDMIGKIIPMSAIIYRNLYMGGSGNNGAAAGTGDQLDCVANFCSMIGREKDLGLQEYLRLFFCVMSDHEGGNVMTHTARLVGSALGDPYISLSAGLNGLLGPKHGHAAQEVTVFLEMLQKKIGFEATDEEIKSTLRAHVKTGQLLPGCGHSVLKKTDPRFTAFQDFGNKFLPDDPKFKFMTRVYQIAPSILMETGKVNRPWPNVEAPNTPILEYFGITGVEYSVVLIAIARTLGVTANLIWDRALGFPIERPKSMSTPGVMLTVLNKRK